MFKLLFENGSEYSWALPLGKRDIKVTLRFLSAVWLLREKNECEIIHSVLAKKQCYKDRTIIQSKSDNFIIEYKSVSPRNEIS